MDATNERQNTPALSPYRELLFDGDQLVAVILDGDGVAMPVRVICQVLGLDVAGQNERIQNHEVLSQGLRVVRVRQGNQLRSMAALLHRYIPFWLATISPNQVNAAARPKLVRYQTELVDVLAALYGGELPTATADATPTTLASLHHDLRAALREARLTREALAAFQEQHLSQLQSHDEQLADHGDQLSRLNGVVDDVMQQLAQHTITAAQQAVISSAIKRLALRYKQQTGKEIFGRLFGQFCTYFAVPRYPLLPASRYDDALDWIRSQAHALLPDDPDAAPPLQASLL